MKKEEFIKLSKELYEVQNWFRQNDWKVNKHVLGEWAEDDPRWTEYLAQRAEKRTRQDELLVLLDPK